MALRPHLGDADLEQVGLFERKSFPFPELAKLGHGHLNVGQVKPALGNECFSAYFKFAFVRNPFDRYVSYCAFISRKSGEFQAAPRDFMKRVLTEIRPVDHLLFRPQWEFICDEKGNIAMDYVARFEHMQKGYRDICARIGVAETALQRINESGREDYRSYFDSELRGMVADAYAEDLTRFGYEFEAAAMAIDGAAVEN